MPQRTIHDDVQAALKRLDVEDPGLRQMLKKAHGYAVFPSVGKAALLIGGAYGRGEVYERGRVIGYATIAQTTIGVQIGGDTFTEVIVFQHPDALERFKRGKTAFAANASAVLVKAGAAGTADFEKGVAAYAYSQGGMLLEAAIGGQRFHFQPIDQDEEEENQEQQPARGRRGAQARSGAGSRRDDDEGEAEQSDQGQDDRGMLGSATRGIKTAATRTADLAREHPVAATLIGTGVLAGVGLLVMRAMRSSGSAADAEGSDDRDADQEDDQSSAEAEYDDQADDQVEDQDARDESDEADDAEAEDQGEEQDDGGADEVEDAPRYSRSRSRG